MAYYTRPMMASDTSDVADLCADVYIRNDKIVAQAWPRAREHFDVWRRWWVRAAKEAFRARGTHISLAVHRAPDNSQRIVGVAVWMRNGPECSPDARAWNQVNEGLGAAFERFLLRWEDRYAFWSRADAAGIDYRTSGAWHAACEEVMHKWHEHLPDSWHLANLAISHDHQRKGLGSMMLGWGIERANVEGVPISLLASPYGLPLYEKHGFRVVEQTVDTDGTNEFDPFLVYEPPELKAGVLSIAEVQAKLERK